jgi:tRNA(Ile)-lysidine synthase
MYYVAVRTLAQTLTEYIRKHDLLKAGDRVGVAVSGGLDSVALLRLLLELRHELGIVLSVVHFNHKLRGADADADQQFVAELARQHKLEFHCQSGDVASRAAEKKLSLESAARDMRYEYFRSLLLRGTPSRIATAHTLDDQAETVLLRLIRGAGTRGLAGIYPRLSVVSSERNPPGAASHREHLAIVRPLLGTRRKDLEGYLVGLGQSWREDGSNRDLRHARNRVRHGILPRLERNLNPAVRQTLAETAEIARAEEEFWESELARLLPQVWQADPVGRSGTVTVAPLADLPLALQRRLMRKIGESLGLRLEFRHVSEILDLISTGSGKAVLPQGWTVSRKQNELRFEPECDAASKESDYEYCLPLPGAVEVPEIGSRFEAVMIQGNEARQYNREDLLDLALLCGGLRVRNWRAGDRFWPAHTKAPKKVKELLQARRVTGLQRKLWPVVVSGKNKGKGKESNNVIWLRGFPAASRSEPAEGVLIREVPLGKAAGQADSPARPRRP